MEYNKKRLNLLKKIKVLGAMSRTLNIYESRIDRKICGCSLTKYVPSLYRETKGATGSQSTRYWVLDEIFGCTEPLKEDDVFIDVGCGKGRVLAYLVRSGFKGSINGIELNKDVADFCAAWADRYDNVHVENADAFECSFDRYTAMFLGRPFEKAFFGKFLEKLEADMTHPLKVYYWVDQQSGDMLNDRPGWKMLTREWIFRKKGFYIASSPQRYSVWIYNPEEKEKQI